MDCRFSHRPTKDSKLQLHHITSARDGAHPVALHQVRSYP
jgi:hypothetical protein